MLISTVVSKARFITESKRRYLCGTILFSFEIIVYSNRYSHFKHRYMTAGYFDA